MTDRVLRNSLARIGREGSAPMGESTLADIAGLIERSKLAIASPTRDVAGARASTCCAGSGSPPTTATG
jgi:hypothetical protein